LGFGLENHFSATDGKLTQYERAISYSVKPGNKLKSQNPNCVPGPTPL